MRIILDPSRDGCTIWFPDRNTIKFIHGYPLDVCKRIYNFSTYYNEDIDAVEQCVTIILDHNGIGIAYRDLLEHQYNLKLELIKPEKELKI